MQRWCGFNDLIFWEIICLWSVSVTVNQHVLCHFLIYKHGFPLLYRAWNIINHHIGTSGWVDLVRRIHCLKTSGEALQILFQFYRNSRPWGQYHSFKAFAHLKCYPFLVSLLQYIISVTLANFSLHTSQMGMSSVALPTP